MLLTIQHQIAKILDNDALLHAVISFLIMFILGALASWLDANV